MTGERFSPDYVCSTPPLSEAVISQAGYYVVTLEALVLMKLTSYRLVDQVHLQDLVGVGLVDNAWPAKYPAPLSERLQQILDNPEA